MSTTDTTTTDLDTLTHALRRSMTVHKLDATPGVKVLFRQAIGVEIAAVVTFDHQGGFLAGTLTTRVNDEAGPRSASPLARFVDVMQWMFE